MTKQQGVCRYNFDSPRRKQAQHFSQKEMYERARKLAHDYFDPLWQRAMNNDGRRKQEARNSAYNWLAKELELTTREAHISRFKVNLCLKVVELCKPLLTKEEHDRIRKENQDYRG